MRISAQYWLIEERIFPRRCLLEPRSSSCFLRVYARLFTLSRWTHKPGRSLPDKVLNLPGQCQSPRRLIPTNRVQRI